MVSFRVFSSFEKFQNPKITGFPEAFSESPEFWKFQNLEFLQNYQNPNIFRILRSQEFFKIEEFPEFQNPSEF